MGKTRGRRVYADAEVESWRRRAYQSSGIGAVEAVDSHGGLDLVDAGRGRGEGPGLREDGALPGDGDPRGAEQ